MTSLHSLLSCVRSLSLRHVANSMTQEADLCQFNTSLQVFVTVIRELINLLNYPCNQRKPCSCEILHPLQGNESCQSHMGKFKGNPTIDVFHFKSIILRNIKSFSLIVFIPPLEWFLKVHDFFFKLFDVFLKQKQTETFIYNKIHL